MRRMHDSDSAGRRSSGGAGRVARGTGDRRRSRRARRGGHRTGSGGHGRAPAGGWRTGRGADGPAVRQSMDGITATAQITGAGDPPRVLVLTTYDTDADILAAVEAGAAGYLL